MTARLPLSHADEETPVIEPDRQFASTLASGLDILLAFRVGDTILGNKDFAERTGLSRPTVARLTHTLTELGYLRRDAVLGKYRLGAAVLSTNYSLLAGLHIRQIAKPLMKTLADRIGGAVSIGLRDGTHMVYVETARSTEQIAFTPDIGATLPMLTTSMGRAWLCRAGARERDETLNRIKLMDPVAWRRHVPQLPAIRGAFEQRGYCACRAEWRDDVYGFAVPLGRPLEGRLFVVNCGVPVDGMTFAAVESAVAPQLVALVQELETLLGMR
ncbi:IclR family transcriptional regulator [Caballeronia sp. J97]|uniref:IclR family transcriptional regulator n=1 Tax=Caballeronia sp. J97 TaxID=2805429 RepID=UPI002AB22688|nr:IclR family transcriptional regulator [Caballeronia sp. J97]